MTTRDAVTKAAVIGAAERSSPPLSHTLRWKQAAAVPILLLGTLLSLPLLLLLCGGEAGVAGEGEE